MIFTDFTRLQEYFVACSLGTSLYIVKESKFLISREIASPSNTNKKDDDRCKFGNVSIYRNLSPILWIYFVSVFGDLSWFFLSLLTGRKSQQHWQYHCRMLPIYVLELQFQVSTLCAPLRARTRKSSSKLIIYAPTMSACRPKRTPLYELHAPTVQGTFIHYVIISSEGEWVIHNITLTT